MSKFRFLSCVTDIYSKCAWVIPLRDKKGMPINNAFQKVLNSPNSKRNKTLVDKNTEIIFAE